MQLKLGRAEMTGDIFVIIDPSDWKQLKEEENLANQAFQQISD